MSYTRKDHVTINKSGHDGGNGSSGSSGYSGSNGSNGHAGQDGDNATRIDVSLTVPNDAQYVVVKDTHILKQDALPLGSAHATIDLIAHGGDGGRGGDGGNGGRGKNGSDGHDASMYCHGTNGEDGGNGGNGGNGGRGGDAGHGADITVTVNESDMDQLMKLNRIDTRGGDGGRGGSGGSGGSGGRGGSGGSSYTWTTSHTDSEGHTHYDTHYTPGGYDGSNGHSGSCGHNGSSGSDGYNGAYTIIIPTLGRFKGRYNLSLTALPLPKSSDNIIEPEEALTIPYLRLKNIGEMPTPTYQPITIALSTNNWIDFDPDNRLKIDKPFYPGESVKVKDPLHLSIQPATRLPRINKPLREQATLETIATVTRANKLFETVRKQTHHVTIQYPVELTIISGAHAIQAHETAPIAIGIRNISSQAIGMRSKQKRALTSRLTITNKYSDSLLFVPKTDSTHPGRENVIDVLQPGETVFHSGLLSFVRKDVPPYTQIKFAFHLDLGELHNPGKPQDIQKNTFSLQLSEGYTHNPNADFVLVTNCNTSQETIRRWQGYAASFGSELVTWNVSLYGGLSYTQKREDGYSFMSELGNKTIVILDDEYETERKKQTHASDHLDQMEILTAAKQEGISTYVIGNHFNLRDASTPQQDYPVTDHESTTKLVRNYDADHKHHVDISVSKIFWSSPKEKHLNKKAKSLNQELKARYSEQDHLTTFDYRPEKMPNQKWHLFKKWRLGSLQVTPSLDARETSIAQRNHESGGDRHDIYAVTKLMPFNRKMDYLYFLLDANDDQTQNLAILEKAILSDLITEMDTFTKRKWLGPYSRREFHQAFTTLGAFEDADLAIMCLTEKGHDFLRDLLLKLEYVAKHQESVADSLFCPWARRRYLAESHTVSFVKATLKKFFPEESFKDERKQLHQQYKKLKRSELINRFSRPDDLIITRQEAQPDVINKRHLSFYRPKVSSFIEGRHFYRNKMESDAAITEHEQRALRS